MIVRIKLDYFRQGDHFRGVLERSVSISEAFKQHAQQLASECSADEINYTTAANTMKVVADILNGCQDISLLHIEPNAVYIGGPDLVMKKLMEAKVADPVEKGALYFVSDEDDGECG
jgi:hypothetical protein